MSEKEIDSLENYLIDFFQKNRTGVEEVATHDGYTYDEYVKKMVYCISESMRNK